MKARMVWAYRISGRLYFLNPATASLFKVDGKAPKRERVRVYR